MQRKIIRRKRRPSLILSAIDRFSAFIYSFFFHGRVGDMLSSSDTLCKRSYLSGFFSRKSHVTVKKTVMDRANAIVESSAVARFVNFITEFLADLKIHVYGTFLTVFGLTCAITQLISALLNGVESIDMTVIIVSSIIAVCSVPLLFSSLPAIEAIANSSFLHKVTLDILCIPPENLKAKRQYGGTACIFIAALIAILLGGLSYFVSPLYFILLFVCILASVAILSLPETGVIVTLALLPFMQYTVDPTLILFSLLAITSVSYIFKVLERKRTVSLSPEITMVLIFCGFILAGGFLSKGGIQTFLDGVLTVFLILGGFFLTYNLINTEKMIAACLKTLTASFLVLCFIGIWDGFYNGVSARIIDSVEPRITPLTEESVLYIADNGAVFGLFAIILFPMLCAYIAKRKTVQGFFSVVLFMLISVIAASACSYYEIVVVLFIEFAIYWLINGYKAIKFLIVALMPIGFIYALYPFGMTYLGFPNVGQLLMEYMPASTHESAFHPQIAIDVIEMLFDGNILGIGAGEHAFESVFPAYAGVVSVGASDPSSLWLEILCWSGIFGFITFSVFLIFLVKRSFGFFIDPYSKELRTKAIALFCGIVGAMLFGCVYSIWSDYRVLYLFWAAVGLLMCYIRLGRNGDETKRAEFADGINAKDIELIFYK